MSRNIIIGSLVLFLCLFAFLSCFVWIPDIGASKVHVLASASTRQGTLAVLQWWNRMDFYSTIVVFHDQKSHEWHYATLDGDDVKRWRASIEVKDADELFEVKIAYSRSLFAFPSRSNAPDHSQLSKAPYDYQLFEAPKDLIDFLGANIPAGLASLKHCGADCLTPSRPARDKCFPFVPKPEGNQAREKSGLCGWSYREG